MNKLFKWFTKYAVLSTLSASVLLILLAVALIFAVEIAFIVLRYAIAAVCAFAGIYMFIMFIHCMAVHIGSKRNGK